MKKKECKYTVIANGLKAGQQVRLECKDGIFSLTGNAAWDNEIFDLMLEPVKIGGSYRLSGLEPLRAQWVIAQFFDEPPQTEWIGIEEPFLESQPGVIY